MDGKARLKPPDDTNGRQAGGGLRGLPQRYTIRETDSGRVLTCVEAPNITVQVNRGMSVSAASARKAPSFTIYLDGVAQSEPFMDLEKQIYNFDHHEGVLRQFTLSTCEQVLVMVLKGMDLRGRDWKVYANEPDLDTLLAIWLILNHVRLQPRESGGLQFLNMLIRLEGIIDTHGLEMMSLSGFPPDLLARGKRAVDYLRAEEVELKRNGVWEESDPLEHTALILHKIDRLVYKTADFTDFKDLRELARVEIANNRIAVVVEADLGIYELEPYLNRMYGESLGIVALRKDGDNYTLRRLDPFMPGDLHRVYRKLNDMDPAVRCRTDGSRWGGSGDIGGSPRGVGTQLSPDEIARAFRDAFQKPGLIGNLRRMVAATAVTAGLIFVSVLAHPHLARMTWIAGTPVEGLLSRTAFFFFLTLAIGSLLCTYLFSRRKVWLFGLTGASGKDWWLLLPFVMLAAAAGGVYSPKNQLLEFHPFDRIFYGFILIPLALEILFRGLAHGILIRGHAVQTAESRWFFSYPVVVSGLLYAFCIVFLATSPLLGQGAFELQSAARSFFAAFAFGLAAGFVRERSQSLLPAALFHGMAIAALFLI
ncbi:MAG: type II CAAX prenyl endopeptidase Rce1 family protein [Desulfobacterales bacterium]